MVNQRTVVIIVILVILLLYQTTLPVGEHRVTRSITDPLYPSLGVSGAESDDAHSFFGPPVWLTPQSVAFVVSGDPLNEVWVCELYRKNISMLSPARIRVRLNGVNVVLYGVEGSLQVTCFSRDEHGNYKRVSEVAQKTRDKP